MILHSFTPGDVAEAAEEWRATCGPCALAAALGVNVKHVRQAVSPPSGTELPGIIPAFRGWMSIAQMKAAVASLDLRLAAMRSSPSVEQVTEDSRDLGNVLACLQWGGPWGGRAAATHRHWVVFRQVTGGEYEGLWIYDWNARHLVTRRVYDGVTPNVEGSRWRDEPWSLPGGWLRFEQWESAMLPRLLPERGDGTWRIQWSGAVRP